jgi:hypothetical protein
LRRCGTRRLRCAARRAVGLQTPREHSFMQSEGVIEVIRVSVSTAEGDLLIELRVRRVQGIP